MKLRVYAVIVVGLLGSGPLFAQPARTPESPVESWKKTDLRMNDNCSACHQRLGEPLAMQVSQWQGSVHAQKGVFCDSCHGGDPTSTVLTVAMGEQNGFMEAPQPLAVPDDCGRCHEDALASFKESAHGELFESNDYEPSCVTCHNSHDVKAVSFDMVAMPASCGECHEQNYIDEVRNPLAETDRRMERLRAQIASLPASNPNAAYLHRRLDKASEAFSRLAHFLNANTITTQRQTLDRELTYLEFMVAFDDTKTSD